jgi:hypothetical protein
MATKNGVANNGTNWQAIEAVIECAVEFRVVSAFAFIEKSVDVVDTDRFMIST